MNRGTQMHLADWDQQQEQLSAYLDGELSLAEREALERHLPTCARCQQALAELRVVRRLLHAMPAPALPRSFTLPPAGGPVPVPLRERAAQRRSTPPTPNVAARIARQVGGLAAAVGLALLLGSALLGQGQQNATSALFGRSAAPAGDKNTQQSPSTPRVGVGGTVGATPGATGTPGGVIAGGTQTPATPQNREHTPTTAPPSPTSTSAGKETTQPSTESSAEVPVLPIAGTGLFVGGAALYIGGRVAGRRRPGQRAS